MMGNRNAVRLKQRPKPNSILAAPLIVGREHKRNKQKETAGRQHSRAAVTPVRTDSGAGLLL